MRRSLLSRASREIREGDGETRGRAQAPGQPKVTGSGLRSDTRVVAEEKDLRDDYQSGGQERQRHHVFGGWISAEAVRHDEINAIAIFLRERGQCGPNPAPSPKWPSSCWSISPFSNLASLPSRGLL